MSQMESKGIKWSTTILIMISRDWMRILHIDMSWEVDINMIDQKKMKRKEVKYVSKYENYGPEARKFQIQKYKVIMGYKYLCVL